MDLTVVGAGPAYSDRPGAVGAAYLVRHDGAALLLDLGHGAFSNLAREIEPSELSGVVISHLHPDHFIDLVPLRHYLRYEFDPARRVTVHGPAGLGDRIDALHDEPGFSAAALDVEALAEGSADIGPLHVEARRVRHTDDSFAFRVSSDGSGPGLVYSGDCGRADDLAPLVQPGDVLLTEVSFGPGPVPPGAEHLDGAGVGDLAAGTRVGRLLLTHIQMGYDREATLAAVGSRFAGDARFVEPGDRLTV